jgi:MoaA/NifB/PqqE/SkfB family radical SAM enzyme
MNVKKGPWRITFDTNPDDCNLNCIMCEGFSEYAPLHRGKHRRMNFSIIEEVVKEMVPEGLTEIIPSTMGEPLLYDHFEDMLKLCKHYGIKLNLTTNGTWPKYTPEAWAESICPVTSDVKISWNGATKETQEKIMPGSLYEKRLSDLKRFVKARDEIALVGGNYCTVTLQVTFMEINLNELPSLITFAASLGVDRVKGHHLWVIFNKLKKQDLRRNQESRQRWNKTLELCQKEANRKTWSKGKSIKLENFNQLSERMSNLPNNWVCPFLGKEAWINAEGRFDPCCAPDKERKTLGYFGTIPRADFKEIWSSQSYQKLKNSYLCNQVCQKCNMRRPPQNG